MTHTCKNCWYACAKETWVELVVSCDMGPMGQMEMGKHGDMTGGGGGVDEPADIIDLLGAAHTNDPYN